ncbi:unnamed protein product [Prorocentrum cordatum]|uniref:Uncharacterized protein n=1 Tax=Prorocentrum cordatum TaxID=2364126 RepID=A0ABN9UMS7_9DINO|nr:unnamed protein product [Polarella glacialis]
MHARARVLRHAAKGPRLERPVAAAADAAEDTEADNKFIVLRAEAPVFLGAGSWEPIRDPAVCDAGLRCACGALVYSSLAGDPPCVAKSGVRHIECDRVVIHQKSVCEGFRKCAEENPRNTSASWVGRLVDSESEEVYTDNHEFALAALPGGGFIFPCADPGGNSFGASFDVQATSEDEAAISGLIRARELELQTWSARPPVRAMRARSRPFVRRRAKLEQQAASFALGNRSYGTGAQAFWRGLRVRDHSHSCGGASR